MKKKELASLKLFNSLAGRRTERGDPEEHRENLRELTRTKKNKKRYFTTEDTEKKQNN